MKTPAKLILSNLALTDQAAPARAALYLRVSIGRQADNDLSICRFPISASRP
ncbi:hypothetical protein [Mesorhizobium amorphae]|uniref:hypothetical protein n=1 Tax=Mesorhizobium amorphae TaxID=71433 RepID=UPI0031F48E2A